MGRDFCFISTNAIWGGSEELWVRAAARLLNGGRRVSFCTYYTHPNLQQLEESGAQWTSLVVHKSIYKRIIQAGLVRLRASEAVLENAFVTLIKKLTPSFVIISQGNSTEANECMKACTLLKVPFVTITQLVTEFTWLGTNDKKIEELFKGYNTAQMNFFVSASNKALNDLMMGNVVKKARIAFNPFDSTAFVENSYPASLPHLSIAVVGRLECMHKGLDLIVQVFMQEKWRSRAVKITFYGSGPHEQWLRRMISTHGLTMMQLAGHIQDKKKIWSENQVLLMASRMEGQSLALIEAMYCNRAAVVTDVGGVRELIEEGVNGFIAAWPSVIELDRSLEELWKNKERLEDMGRKAGAQVRAVYPADPVAHFNEQLLEIANSIG